MVNPGAINRDPRRFDEPHDFNFERSNVREHLAFGCGAHSCPGGPLARVEGRVSIERLLDRMDDLRLDEEKHGPEGDRTFNYEPTFILRGLTEINIEFTPAARRRHLVAFGPERREFRDHQHGQYRRGLLRPI